MLILEPTGRFLSMPDPAKGFLQSLLEYVELENMSEH